ncbi:hypothetical protein A2159_01595, partial [Candidatus Woesebacteria bacterium RBG_13_34_9]
RAFEANELSKIDLKRPILDLGCGYGEFAGVFYDASVEVGVDLSGRDLQIAAQNKKYSELVLADARRLPFPDSSFNSILSVSVIEHIKNTRKILSEVNRVLTSGGKFVFTTPDKDFTSFLFYPLLFQSLKLNFLAEYYKKAVNNIFKHDSLYTEPQWRKMLKGTGFEVERIEKIIPRKAVMLWDFLLVFALPSQILKLIFGKRIVIKNELRIKLVYQLLTNVVKKDSGTRSNFLIIARKL